MTHTFIEGQIIKMKMKRMSLEAKTIHLFHDTTETVHPRSKGSLSGLLFFMIMIVLCGCGWLLWVGMWKKLQETQTLSQINSPPS